jgi:hypothetical protein
MKKKSLWLFLCLLISVGMTGCKNRESDAATGDAAKIFEAKLRSATSSGISAKEDLPEWLSAEITKRKNVHGKDFSILKVRVFQGKWKNGTVYILLNNLASCMLCEIYDGDGGNIIIRPGDLPSNDFYMDSENWQLIYEFGNGEIY